MRGLPLRSTVPLNFENFGEGGVRPLVILHGLFGHAQNWRSVAKALSTRLSRRVIVAELRNHGASPRTPTMLYPEMAADVLELAQKQAPGGIDLLGHSMGGKTAMHAALTGSPLIRRLVVEDVAPRRYEANNAVFRQMIRAMRDLDLSRPRNELPELLGQTVTGKAVRDFLLTNVANVNGKLEWKMNLDAIEEYIDHVLGAENIQGLFDRPTLFVHGGDSAYVRAEDHAVIRKMFPKSSIECIPGAGHWLHAEKPTEFIHSVVQFLNSTE